MAMTSKPDHISFGASVTDLGRALLSVFLVILLLIPAVIIRIADEVTMWWIRRKGGLE